MGRINGGLMSNNSNEWATPQAFFDTLNAEFHFTLDPCSTDLNAKCKKHFTKAENGLLQDWSGERVFCNPPYGSEIGAWCKKAFEESEGGKSLVVMLIPARTDTAYFHDYIYHHAELRFIRGRLKFVPENAEQATTTAPFPSLVAIFGGGTHE